MKSFDEINEIISALDDTSFMIMRSAIAEYYDFGNSKRLEIFAEKNNLTIKEIFYWYNY